MLRVRDPRISTSSLAVFCDKNRASLEPSARDRVAAALLKGEEGYMWERAADLLGVTVAQVQSWISAGQLRVVDTFVTDRSFEEFCKKHGERNQYDTDGSGHCKMVGEGVRRVRLRSQTIVRFLGLKSMRW